MAAIVSRARSAVGLRLADEARGLAAGGLAQPAPFQQLDVAPAVAGQEVRHGGADRAAADDGDLRISRAGHDRPPPDLPAPGPGYWYAQRIEDGKPGRQGLPCRQAAAAEAPGRAPAVAQPKRLRYGSASAQVSPE